MGSLLFWKEPENWEIQKENTTGKLVLVNIAELEDSHTEQVNVWLRKEVFEKTKNGEYLFVKKKRVAYIQIENVLFSLNSRFFRCGEKLLKNEIQRIHEECVEMQLNENCKFLIHKELMEKLKESDSDTVRFEKHRLFKYQVLRVEEYTFSLNGDTIRQSFKDVLETTRVLREDERSTLEEYI